MRAFLKFDGEGETANARERAIGGHPAVLLRGVCRRRDPSSPHADQDGYVPFGKLVNYAAGRSDGCTSWSPSDAEAIMGMVRNYPTTLYIYPEFRDIDAVARAVAAGRSASRVGLYWNAACLKDIGAPRFLAEGIVRADPCAVSGGPSCSAAAAAADLQGALSGHRRSVLADVTSQRLQVMLVALKGQARAVEHGGARHRFAFLGLAGLTALGDVNRAESRAASSGTESLNGCCAQRAVGPDGVVKGTNRPVSGLSILAEKLGVQPKFSDLKKSPTKSGLRSTCIIATGLYESDRPARIDPPGGFRMPR